MISSLFETLQTAPVVNEFIINIPGGILSPNQQSKTFNLFEVIGPFIRIFRMSITGFICLITAISCYKKVIVLFEK